MKSKAYLGSHVLVSAKVNRIIISKKIFVGLEWKYKTEEIHIIGFDYMSKIRANQYFIPTQKQVIRLLKEKYNIEFKINDYLKSKNGYQFDSIYSAIDEYLFEIINTNF